MLVCHCEVVSDREIHDAVAAGARDEFDVARVCGAGSVCGGCVPAISAILDAGGCATRCPLPPSLRPSVVQVTARGTARPVLGPAPSWAPAAS